MRAQLNQKPATIQIDDEESDDEDEEDDDEEVAGAASSSLDDSEHRSVDGESFEKKRCLNSSYE